MAAVEYDWSQVTGHAVERLRAPKVAPVPERIIALAQASWDGVTNKENPEGDKLHVLRHQFDTPERAQAFGKLMKKAGEHTEPRTSVTVVFDPDAEEPSNLTLVAWRAGARRGRASSSE